MERRKDLEVFPSVKGFWDACHHKSAGGDLTWYLTASDPTSELGNLNVASFLSSPRTILVVGVGQGHTTRFLSQTGHRVDALDISEDALAKVQPITQRQFTPDRFSSMPERQYDLAISHLVAQHMNDADLELQMYYVCRALKPGGTFALQFSSALLPEERSRMKITRPLDCMEGSVTRSLGIFEQIVSRAGGDIQLVFRHSTYPNYNLIWYVAHVQPFVR